MLTTTSFALLALGAFSSAVSSVKGQAALVQSEEYASGALGPGPFQTYHSSPATP
jgi:hypothetical protein